MIRAAGATPAMPTPSPVPAAAMPATWVPCPLASTAPSTELREPVDPRKDDAAADPPGEVGVGADHPGVHHRDVDPRSGARGPQGLDVELVERPLLRTVRVSAAWRRRRAVASSSVDPAPRRPRPGAGSASSDAVATAAPAGVGGHDLGAAGVVDRHQPRRRLPPRRHRPWAGRLRQRASRWRTRGWPGASLRGRRGGGRTTPITSASARSVPRATARVRLCSSAPLSSVDDRTTTGSAVLCPT